MTIVAGTVALNISCDGFFCQDGLIDNDHKKVTLRNIPNSRLECQNYTLFKTKMAKINTLFMTKTAEKPYILGPHIPMI